MTVFSEGQIVIRRNFLKLRNRVLAAVGICGCAVSVRHVLTAGGSVAVILRVNEADLVYYYFCSIALCTLRIGPASGLKSAAYAYRSSFFEISCDEFSLLTPCYAVDKIGALSAFILRKAALYADRERGYANTVVGLL